MRYRARFVLITIVISLGLTACAGVKKRDMGLGEKGFKVFRTDDYRAAMIELLPLVRQGNPEAQFRLASMYHEGAGVPQNHVEAEKLFLAAAGQGHALAQFNLGMIYAEGRTGVPKNTVAAWKWFNLVAAQGSDEARQFRDNLATTMTTAQLTQAQKLSAEFQPEDIHVSVFKEALAQALKGDAAAQLRVGVRYYRGQGTTQNFTEALKWFRASGGQGNPYAQSNTGYMFEKGQGAPQDFPEAARWYRLAAEQGNAFAQLSLARMYEKGQGVIQDEVQAIKWYNLAAAQGNERARTLRDRLIFIVTPEQVAEAHRLSREFKPKAAK